MSKVKAEKKTKSREPGLAGLIKNGGKENVEKKEEEEKDEE